MWITGRRGQELWAMAFAALLASGCGLKPPASAPGPNPNDPGVGSGVGGSDAPPDGVDAGTPTASAGSPDGSGPPVVPFTGYTLAWNDEFDGDALEPTRWRADVGPRGAGVMTPEAVSVGGGALRVAVYTEGGVTKTGFLSTESKFGQRYGYFESRIRFHSAPGEWCAFWLQSPTIGQPIGNPAIAGTEIDVIEHRYTDDGGWELQDWVAQNLNWDGYGPEVKRAQHVAQLPGKVKVQDAWHTYGVLWARDGYTFYVDGNPVWRTTEAVSQRPEFLQLTCEVEGQGWAGSMPAGGYGPRDASQVGMEVDWVRAWQAPPEPDPVPPPVTSDPSPVPTLPAGYSLAWRDEFDGPALDLSKWLPFDAPRADAIDTPEALTFGDGTLSLRTYDEGGAIKTGFLTTEGRFESTYGYFEARIRFRGTPGQWCAFWLMSPTLGVPLGDPATAGTEIDIAEHRFTDQSGGMFADQVGQNVLWDGYGAHRTITNHVDYLPDGSGIQNVWHTYGVLWDETGYRFYVDASEVWTANAPVSRRSEYVILSCEVIQHEWAGDVPPGGFGSHATSTTGMDVDWVRVWKRN